MKSSITAVVAAVLLLLSAPGSTQSLAAQTLEMTEAEDGSAGEIDDEAVAVLRALSDHLAGLSEFSYRYEASHDTVQSSGLKVEFGSARRILVSRPDRLRMDGERRDGVRNTIVFSGEKIFAYAPDQQVYASADQPGDLDEAIAFAIQELRLKAPVSGLVSSNFFDDAMQNLKRAYYLGVSRLTGEDCDHLLLSNDFTDFQLWVTRTPTPVLQRVVITYREEPGQPQFRAHFMDWNLDPEIAPEDLNFVPPEDAARVRFYVEARPLDPTPGAAQ